MQGAVNPDEFYVYKPALRAGRPAILKRGVGDKATKMVYTDDADRRADDGVRRRRPGASGALLSLTDDEVEELARQALVIEEHYGRPMDIEWGKDGVDGELYILQARPETVQSRAGAGNVQRYRLRPSTGAGAGRGPGDRAEDRRRRRCGCCTSVDQMHEFRRARCWSPT